MPLRERTAGAASYRADLDGLRAWAVLAVILFHAWPAHFPSGHIGVDIFFVISGYLITRIIMDARARGGFSFLAFYHRRVLRIVAPLLPVLLCCLVAGYWLLTPGEYAQLGANAGAGAFFWANFHLMAEAGYFDVASTFKPLLHLWSLGIEEQFYIVFPLLLLLGARFPAALFLAPLLALLCLLAGADLTSWLLAPRDAASGVYYSPFTRAFALLAGAALALAPHGRPMPSWLGCACALAGIALLGCSFYLAAGQKLWPSRLAALPVLGTALIIYAGPANAISRVLLASPWVAGLGLLSYELYLWHWPLLAFANILGGGQEQTPHWLRGLLLLAAFGIAGLAYFGWGRPLRERYRHRKSMSIVFLILLGLLGLGAFGIAAWRGLPGRIAAAPALKGWEAPGVEEDARRAAPLYPQWREFTDAPNQVALQAAPEQLDVALIGDSHAQQLYAGLKDALAGKAKLGVFPASGQAPWPGVATLTDGMTNYRKHGHRLMDMAYATVLRNPGIRTVILAHNPLFSMLDTLDPARPDQGLTAAERDALLLGAMRRGLAALTAAGKKVVIVLDNPALDFDPRILEPRPLRIAGAGGRRTMLRAVAEAAPAREWYARLCAQAAAGLDNVYIVDLFDAFCDAESCKAWKDGQPLYWDASHLTYAGSKLAGKFLAKKLTETR